MADIDPARLPELYEAIRQIPASIVLAEVVNAILKSALTLLNAEQAFFKPTGSYIHSYSFPILDLDSKSEYPFEKELESLVNEIEQSQETLVISNTKNEPRFAAEPLSTVFDSCPVLISPLKDESFFFGILIIKRAISASTFSLNELAELKFFIQWAALALRAVQMSDMSLSFVSMLAHEITSPLTSVKGFTDILQKELAGPLTEPQKDFLRRISYNADKMNGLIHAQVEIARIKSKRVRLRLKAVNLREQIEKVISYRQNLIQGRSHSLSLNFRSSPLVHVDEFHLWQVIDILLDNALQYTAPSGEIEFACEEQDSFAKLSISDNGAGIPHKDHSKVFSEFYLGQNIYKLNVPRGNGLNLYIAKNWIELMGGQIGFTSEENKGSTFWFTLPITKEETPTTN